MTLNCNGTLVDVSKPRIMGILNITPDSFYDGGQFHNEQAILLQAEKLLKEGATFLDVGGYSSRPRASEVSETEEIKRVIPIISSIVKSFPEAIVSVDTFRSQVARAAIETGAALVNDISAGNLDANMMKIVAQFQVPYIMMHLKGTPQTMTQEANYENVTKEVLYYFSKKMVEARNHGINDLVIDPGFGFAKSITQNFELLNHLGLFSTLEVPLLVGISRKSMIYKTLQTSPQEALNGTTSLHSIALLKGANILRVHDVKEAMECVKLMENFKI